MAKRETADIVIVGGGIMGSAVAWWLTRNGQPTRRVVVIERDPSYRLASTTHTNSCIRQQFGSEINILLSQSSLQFMRDIKDWMGSDAPEIHFQNFGYLYLATTGAGVEQLRAKQALQALCGAATQLLEPEEIASRFPFLHVDDVMLGSHNAESEGYFDGGTLFDLFRKGAIAAGAEFIHDEVTEITTTNGAVTSLRCASGRQIDCDTMVNASGPRAADVMRMAGLDLPVTPRKRFTFVFDAAEPLPADLPLTIDPSGVHVRSDGRYYMAGCAPEDDRPVAPDDFEPDHSIFEEKVWPTIAHRVPAFERIKLINEWVGHYAYNELDQNAIVGPHPEVSNLLLLNGFSGHGLQQAAPLARGIAEWITHGQWQTLDLTPLTMQRIIENRPLREANVI
ncbi:MAG: FAD-dependent oxidoreductase [Rhodobacterales bacterium]|nr:MAG: FAD-dependent oxidoreductase [Rhodobacterales bacterium]